MSQDEPNAVERAAVDNDRPTTATWVRRGVMVLVALAVAFILYKIAASFLPRWWSQRIQDQVGGSFTGGTLWGLFYGFTFTFLPLVIFFQARRRMFKWRAKLIVVLVAVALATPNWLTLAVVVGNSNAAHAGERIMDVDAPGFRWATLIGVGVGAFLAILLSGTSMAMSRKRKQVKSLKDQVKAGERERRESTRPDPSEPPEEPDQPGR